DATQVPRDVLRLNVTASEPGRFVLAAELLPAEGGRVRLDGEGLASADGYAFALAGSGRLAAPAHLLRGATLDTLTLQASGDTGPEGLRALHVAFAVGGAEWRELTAHSLRVELAADSAELRLDT